MVEMTGEDLKTIGITVFGIRHRILKKIRELVHSSNEGEILNDLVIRYLWYTIDHSLLPMGVAKHTQGTQLIELSPDDKEFIDTSELVSGVCNQVGVVMSGYQLDAENDMSAS